MNRRRAAKFSPGCDVLEGRALLSATVLQPIDGGQPVVLAPPEASPGLLAAGTNQDPNAADNAAVEPSFVAPLATRSKGFGFVE